MTFKDIAGVKHMYETERVEFHTPAEHVLDGIAPDLEMQIIHSKANSTKKTVLSILFSIVEEDVEKTMQ
jgi:carbonic anhydrase